MQDLFIRGLAIDWQEIAAASYLRTITALKKCRQLNFTANITCFVGENGTGKSTLLEAIAVAYGFNPEGGTLNYRFSTHKAKPELADAVKLLKGCRRSGSSYFFRAESFFNLATQAEEYESKYGGRNLHEQSHGESFLAFFQTFKNQGLYLMDEPEAALSPQRQLALFRQIALMADAGAQFILATHSPILLGIPQAAVWSFDDGRIAPCSYEETASYQVMEMFINKRQALIRNLLSD